MARWKLAGAAAVSLLALPLVAVAAPNAPNAPDAPPDPTPRLAPPPYTPAPSTEETSPVPANQGVYAAPELKLTTVSGTAALMAGGSIGWVLEHRFILGGAGYALVTDVNSPGALQPGAGRVAQLSLAYGGVRMGGVVAPSRVVHLAFGCVIGGGSATSETRFGDMRKSDSFFVLEPDVSGEVNVGKNARLDLGVGWRFTGPTEVAGLDRSTLGGPVAAVSLKLGWF